MTLGHPQTGENEKIIKVQKTTGKVSEFDWDSIPDAFEITRPEIASEDFGHGKIYISGPALILKTNFGNQFYKLTY